jgi:hypothetical protein
VLPDQGYRTAQGCGDRCVRSSGGMVISMEKSILTEKSIPETFRPS